MLPRQQRWPLLAPLGVAVPQAAAHRRLAYFIAALLFFCVALVHHVSATTAAESVDPTVHADTGLRVISGASFRAFSNKFRRHLRGKSDCLTFHEADNWWRYEWCVGRHVRQLHVYSSSSSSRSEHEDTSNKSHREWSITLGTFTTDASRRMRIVRLDGDLDAARHPELLGYLVEQLYPMGDVCGPLDLDNLDNQNHKKPTPRSVTIQYKCCVFRANETYIEAVDEPSLCKYTLSVCTPVACGLVQKDQYVFGASTSVSEEERLVLVATVKEMFYHAYHGYMDHAFPLDALLPLSCKGETFELGKIQMLTLIDTLDTLAILEDAHEFQRAVQLVIERADFDLDTEVSVFETTIRVLGGLLSAHLFAIDEKLRLFPHGKYNNELLVLAIGLADRLMPAFNTTTGIPYGTVNLRFGVPEGETPIASTAGAGSLSMEFTMLSVLTGNASYANASRKAVRALFVRRSQVGLLGKHIDTKTGEWTETSSGPGSNSDSFYEYLWKMYVTFDDNEMLEMFDTVYAAVMACNVHGDWFADVSMWSGCGHGNSVIFENLVAFWPGMQASMGHLNAASRSMNSFYRVWREYGFVPEQFNVLSWKPVRGGSAASYPLRPELIESTFHMHEATQDPSWLRAGAHFVHSLQKHTKTKCGYATVRDIDTKELYDQMPSFFLSETCKYLYLLFNTTHFIRQGNYVFTTEAHPFPVGVGNATQVASVLLPTTTGSTAVAADAGDDEASRIVLNRRQCPKPVFWHPLGYQLDYEGLVVDRTERCAKPMSHRTSSPSTGDVGAAVRHQKDVADWLPLFEKQIRAQLDQIEREKKQNQLRAATPVDGEEGEEDGEERMLRLSDLSPEVNAAYGLDRRDTTTTTTTHQVLSDNTFQYLHGGPRLGLFRVDKMDGIIRVTRQDTSEWIETTGMEDARFNVLSWLPERRGFSGNVGVPEDLDEDDELPLLLPHHRLYDFAHGRHKPALRRHCRLHVHVEMAVDMDMGPGKKNPYTAAAAAAGASHEDPTKKSFAFSCAGSSFGVAPIERGSSKFPLAKMVLAEPLDGCTPLANGAVVKGMVVIIKRGACFFETKARNAASAGAVGVVIVNNEDEDRVMVMSGSSGHHGEYEYDDHDGGDADSKQQQQSVAVPAVMVPRRVGEWLHRQMLKTFGVQAEVELVVAHREDELESIYDILEAAEEANTMTTKEALSAAKEVYPRMEIVGNKLHVFAPDWGVELTPVRRVDAEGPYHDWALQIVSKPQTKESASKHSA